VINATTHTGAERALNETAAPVPVRRLSSRAVAVLVGIELLLLFGVLLWALFTLLPSATPLAATADLAPVQQAIKARIVGVVDDPLVSLAPKVHARASNLRGLSLNGVTYYYYVEGADNFDPLSRGMVGKEAVEVLLRDTSGPHSFVVYRIL
jgi:hypothetical protein